MWTLIGTSLAQTPPVVFEALRTREVVAAARVASYCSGSSVSRILTSAARVPPEELPLRWQTHSVGHSTNDAAFLRSVLVAVSDNDPPSIVYRGPHLGVPRYVIGSAPGDATTDGLPTAMAACSLTLEPGPFDLVDVVSAQCPDHFEHVSMPPFQPDTWTMAAGTYRLERVVDQVSRQRAQPFFIYCVEAEQRCAYGFSSLYADQKTGQSLVKRA